MTNIVNEPQPPRTPVQVAFWWVWGGPEQTYTYDGDTFPYTTDGTGKSKPPPIERYKAKTTPIVLPVTFVAITDAEQEAKEPREEKYPIVIAPAGVKILEYLWDFGDGILGSGPVVTHTYKVLNPEVEVKLTVVDSRNMRWSASRVVALVFQQVGYFRGYVNREDYKAQIHEGP